MIRPDRAKGREGKHLKWRIRLFVTGAVAAALGMYYDRRVLIWTAIAVLAVGFFLRYLPSERTNDDP